MRQTLIAVMAALWALAISAHAGTTFFAGGKISTGVTLSAAAGDPAGYAGVSLVRNQIPGELARQKNTAKTGFPDQVFMTDINQAYFLTDVGSQWPSNVASAQTYLLVAETGPGKNNWTSNAFVGASTGKILKSSIAKGSFEAGEIKIYPIPEPKLVSHNETSIGVGIAAFKDPDGLVVSIILWKRLLGETEWILVAKVPNPAAGTEAVYIDNEVKTGDTYEYALSVSYAWPGGSGAGDLPTEEGVFATQAKSVSGPFTAALVQPTIALKKEPTAAPLMILPHDWLLYPSPINSNTAFLALNARFPGEYEFSAYNIAGEKALELRGKIDKAGQLKLRLSVEKLSNGVYLGRLRLLYKDQMAESKKTQKFAVAR